ncbi:hypothetical protein E2C01_002342 [Portunus trituberculatus]|uniref:Uncharacterized protein n=1 Tax=Portunus trituberculatus TaxID=210409 RepID=A0A5B7CQG5_PORTR|nr:hypothetical protein [Portunus trituberculatus]
MHIPHSSSAGISVTCAVLGMLDLLVVVVVVVVVAAMACKVSERLVHFKGAPHLILYEKTQLSVD